MTMNNLPTDWANRWLGGFCALGAIGGLPVRGADYAAHPALEQMLTLAVTPDSAADDHLPQLAEVQAAWSTALGASAVILVCNPDRARTLLLQASGVVAGEPVAVPANATRALVEAVKHCGAQPRFLDLDAQLALCTDAARLAEVRIVWAQPLGGTLSTYTTVPLPTTATLWLDCADTLPDIAAVTPPDVPTALPTIILYGLHLAQEQDRAGALLAFYAGGESLYAHLQSLLQPDDMPDLTLVQAQYLRLIGTVEQPGLAQQQHIVLDEAWHGLCDAAGLPLLPLTTSRGLAHSVAVRIPDECDAATFYAYVRGENTPVRWLPELRPLHYAALRNDGAPQHRATAANLTRWLLAPVGPGYSSEEISHTILGIVKASDYLGVRWYTDPVRATEYAALMNEWYGLHHDAYRPAFNLDTA